MLKRHLFLNFFAIITLSIASCNKTSIDAEDENELITTIKLNFTANGTTQTFSYSDPDGDGGKNPTIDNISLKANTTYTMTIQLLDESKSPVSNITDEVSEQRDEHLFIYMPTPSTLFTYTYGDKDSRNFNVGLTGSIKTGAAATGKLKVQLRHQPPIGGKPSKDGTSNPGSDDVNVDFNVVLQ